MPAVTRAAPVPVPAQLGDSDAEAHLGAGVPGRVDQDRVEHSAARGVERAAAPHRGGGVGRDGVCAVYAAIHHQDPQPGTGQDQRGGGTRGPGSDHDHVVRRDRRCAHRMRRDLRVSGITT